MDLTKYIDLEQVRQTISLMKSNNELFEVRIISSNKFNNYSGYFKDFDTLEPELKKAIAKAQTDNFNVYFTLNEVTDEYYYKEQRNKFLKTSESTGDDAITNYKWLLIDFDPIRKSKISSSEVEKEKAYELMEIVQSNLEQSNFGKPIIADSGNGYHLLYNVDFENTEENKLVVEELLKLLDLMFSTKKVDIDIKVSNPSRITSMYGTLKQKGSNTKERPHRISKLLSTEYGKTDLDIIQKFIKNFKYISDDDTTIERKKTKYFNSEFNLVEWLEENNIPYKLLNKMYKSEWNMYRLDKCYFNNEHDVPTLLEKNGYVKYKCHHNSCSNNTFKKMVEQISPGDVKKIVSSKREQSDLDQFHWLNAKGIPTKVIDIRVANHILKNNNLIMLNGKLYFYENGVYKIDTDDIKVKNLVKECMFEEFVTSRKVMAIVSLIKDDESIHIDRVNKYESYIINFKNGMVNVLTEELFEHDSKYLSVNQVPHNYVKGGKFEDTVFYKFLESRIPDDGDKKMLFEYMGSCLTKDLVFQKMMFIQGVADSGKSNILNYIIHLAGPINSVSIPLQMFSNNRFATSDLLNKSVCFYADLPDEDLEDTGVIKTLTGGDYIRAEYKGGKAFTFRNTAKPLFTCNKVPKAYKEKSKGLYRRYLVIYMENKGDYINNLNKQLYEEKEVEIVIYWLLKNLKNALKRKELFESDRSKRNVQKIRNISDSIQDFLYQTFIEKDSEHYAIPEHDEALRSGRIKRSALYYRYVEFCEKEEIMPVKKGKFFEALESNGVEAKRFEGNFVLKISKIIESFN